MSYAYLLAGENLELAEAELQGFLRAKSINEESEREDRLAFTEIEPGQLKRLALTHEVSEIVERTEELNVDYRPENSFAVRAEDLTGEGDTEKVEKELGEKLLTEKNSVDLEVPDETVRVYILEDEYVIGRQVIDIDRSLFRGRKNQHRPFSSPVSLDPVLARAMVNLAEVPAGGSVLDPFCGTGGILIEAGLCGIGVHGLDIQVEMVEGARENLEEYGIISHDIRKGDISGAGEVFDQKFDAVITDLPYGKASKKEGNPVEDFLEVAPELADGKIVFMSDQEKVNGLEPEFEIYVHRNLTRYLYITQGSR